MFWRPRRGQRQGARDDSPRQFDLERIVAGSLGVGERSFRGAAIISFAGLSAGQSLFSGAGAPWLGCDAAERQSRLPDYTILKLKGGGCGHNGKGIRCTFSYFKIAFVLEKRSACAGNAQRDDHFARCERGLLLGRVARQAIKVFQRNFALSFIAFDLDDGVKGDERHAEIGRMRCDAGLAPSEYGMQTIFAVASVAA